MTVTRGTLLKPDTLMLREHVGEMRDEAGTIVYELSVQLHDRQPIIRHVPTGNWYTISWHEMVGLAEEKGVTNADV